MEDFTGLIDEIYEGGSSWLEGIRENMVAGYGSKAIMSLISYLNGMESPYGLEVKNTLGYMDQDEFALKTRLCGWLGIRPVFVCRMLPKTWIYQLNQAKGFALVLRYQLYPWTHHQLAKRVAKELGLPVDAPRSLAEATMSRFLRWHMKQV